MAFFASPARAGCFGAAALFLCPLSTTATADEYQWLCARGADTLPQGAWELNASNINRRHKDPGDYPFHDLRAEVEYGVADRSSVLAEAILFRHEHSGEDPAQVRGDGLPFSYSHGDRNFDGREKVHIGLTVAFDLG